MVKLSSFALTPAKLAMALATGTLIYAEPVAAQAGTASTTFLVTATVSSYCTISATPLAFGTYSAAATATGSSTVTITCTSGSAYTVALNFGVNSGSVTGRYMISGGNSLTYNLYTSNTYGTVWGTAVANLVSGTGNGAAQALTVYGQILSGQFSAPGSYSDTVTATVNY